jgi:hypothetical protein
VRVIQIEERALHELKNVYSFTDPGDGLVYVRRRQIDDGSNVK